MSSAANLHCFYGKGTTKQEALQADGKIPLSQITLYGKQKGEPLLLAVLPYIFLKSLLR